jgi:hypothetical protein
LEFREDLRAHPVASIAIDKLLDRHCLRRRGLCALSGLHLYRGHSPAAIACTFSVRLLSITLLSIIFRAHFAFTQDMEPRAYSPSPIDTNFLIGSYLRTTGAVTLDPSLPISNVRASINTALVGYDRTFDLLGQVASAAIVIPYFQAGVSGDVFEASQHINRMGLGDIRLRITENFVGNPALTPAEFAQRQPTTTVGVSLTTIAPTGDYNPQHLVNVSSHRWALKPELGVSQPIGNWFADAAAGAWVFTENSNFVGGHVRGENPLWSLQAHGGYNFRPGLWLALDATHYFGGDTILDGVNNRDFESVSRYGATLSIPLADGFSAKVAWSTWLTAHHNGAYDTVAFTLQYRWFDR